MAHAEMPAAPSTTGERPPTTVPARAALRLLRVERTQRWRIGVLPALGIALAVVIVVAAAVGAVPIAPMTTAAVLANATHLVHLPRAWPAADEVIVLQLRLPRVLGAALVGAALAVAGALFQGLLRNPLADPFLLGTSAGAALGASIAFAVPTLFVMDVLGFSVAAALALVGALLAAGLVYALATRRGETPVVTLLLAGVAVSALLTAAQTLIVALQQRAGWRILDLYYWLAGAITVQSWTQLQLLIPIVFAAILATLLLAPALDAFAAGEEVAAYLGLRVERTKLLIAGLAALLVAVAVSISGLVGFVGLVAPHLCRITLGPRHRLLIPASALTGAIFVVLSDLVARTIVAPSELPLGVVTALLGGPFFLALLRRAGRGYSW